MFTHDRTARSIVHLLLQIAAAVCLTGGLAFAQSTSDSWIGGYSNNWSDSANWSAGSPNNSGSTTYAVTIAPSGLFNTVGLNTSFAVDSLTIGGASCCAAGLYGTGSLTMQVGGALTINYGSLTLSNGAAMMVGSASNSSELQLFGAGTALTVTGDLTNSYHMVTDSSTLTVGGTLNNQQSLQLDNGTTNVNALNNTSYISTIGGALNITGGGLGVTDIAAGATYDVEGAFNVINSGVSTSALANLATVEGYLYLESVPTPTLSLSSLSGALQLNNSSTANVNVLNNPSYLGIGVGSTVNLTGGGLGVTDIAAGTGYGVTGAFNVINGGVSSYALANLATVEGSLYLANGQTTTISSLSGSLELNNSTANVNTLTNTSSVLIDDSGSTVNITGGGLGVTDIAAGSSYQLSGGAFNVINGGISTSALANLATVEGQLYVDNGLTTTLASLNVSGSVYLDESGSGAALAVTGNLTDSGDIEVYGGSLTVGGTLDNQSGLEIYGGMANAGALDNTGDIYIGSGGALVVGTDPPASGYDQVADGTLAEIISDDSDFGAILSADGATLDGTLDIELEGGFTPTVGDTFEFLQFTPGELDGTFANIQNDVFNNGSEQWLVTYDNTDGGVFLTAEATATPEPSTMLLIAPCLVALLYRVRSRRRAVQARA